MTLSITEPSLFTRQNREPLTIVTETGATHTLSRDDLNAVILCTASGGCDITIPTGLPLGFSCIVIQKGAAAVTFTADANLTLALPAANTAATSALDTAVSVIVYATNAAQLVGSLA